MFQIEHPDILKTRRGPNYKIVENASASNNICTIYFSSNGLYFPNDEASFNEQVLENDRYEWEKLYNHGAAKNIFVRDIFKQWYFEGINDECNTIAKVTDLLKDLTEGYQVRCVGSSAGGYAALLFGYYLKAKIIYAFAPQFSLKDQMEGEGCAKNPLLQKYEGHEDYKKYYDISWILNQKDFQSDLIYFYPAYSSIDQKQFKIINGKGNYSIIPIKTKTHGVGFHPLVCRELIKKDKEALLKLLNTIRPNNRFVAMIKTLGFGFTSRYFIRKILKKRKGNVIFLQKYNET